MDKNNSRRKLLKSIIAGSGALVAGKSLPESWTKPVVDSVMLPAHAATTSPQGDSLPASFPTPGTYQFVVPTGATSITVAMSGGGGGGGGAAAGDGGDGGDGELINTVLNVTPGEVLAVVVGAGGAGGGGYIIPPTDGGGFGGIGGEQSSIGTTIASGGGGGGGEGPTPTDGQPGEGPAGGAGGLKFGGFPQPENHGGDGGSGGGASGGTGGLASQDYYTNGGNPGTGGNNGYVNLS